MQNNAPFPWRLRKCQGGSQSAEANDPTVVHRHHCTQSDRNLRSGKEGGRCALIRPILLTLTALMIAVVASPEEQARDSVIRATLENGLPAYFENRRPKDRCEHSEAPSPFFCPAKGIKRPKLAGVPDRVIAPTVAPVNPAWFDGTSREETGLLLLAGCFCCHADI